MSSVTIVRAVEVIESVQLSSSERTVMAALAWKNLRQSEDSGAMIAIGARFQTRAGRPRHGRVTIRFRGGR